MKTLDYYKALSEELARELEKAQGEIELHKPSFTLIGAGTVYGDQEMITQIERKFGIKTHLKLVE